jgi:thiosulfate reductase cytochrome b subunit
VHFIIALALVLFILVHLFQVVVSGFVNLTRSMITGRFVVERENTP